MHIRLLTLDNSKYTEEEQLRKISEEHHEALRARNYYSLVAELIDVMQACKTYLEMLDSDFVMRINEQHIKKLNDRHKLGKIKLIGNRFGEGEGDEV